MLDQDSLPTLKLPNREGFTTAHGFMRRDGKPDTANVACMKNCAGDVRLSSQIPAYAADQLGNLADQRRAMGAIEGLKKVKAGGAGAWGDLPMPGQPQVGAPDSRAIVQWILAGAR